MSWFQSKCVMIACLRWLACCPWYWKNITSFICISINWLGCGEWWVSEWVSGSWRNLFVQLVSIWMVLRAVELGESRYLFFASSFPSASSLLRTSQTADEIKPQSQHQVLFVAVIAEKPPLQIDEWDTRTRRIKSRDLEAANLQQAYDILPPPGQTIETWKNMLLNIRNYNNRITFIIIRHSPSVVSSRLVFHLDSEEWDEDITAKQIPSFIIKIHSWSPWLPSSRLCGHSGADCWFYSVTVYYWQPQLHHCILKNLSLPPPPSK